MLKLTRHEDMYHLFISPQNKPKYLYSNSVEIENSLYSIKLTPLFFVCTKTSTLLSIRNFTYLV